MDSLWPVAQRATGPTTSWGTGFMVCSNLPGALLNREVTEQFNGTLGNTVSFSAGLLHFSSSPESLLCTGDPQEAAPMWVPPPSCWYHTQQCPYPLLAFYSYIQAILSINQTQASLDLCSSPVPLQVLCRVLPYEAYNRGLVPTSQAWGPLGSMPFPLRLLQPQACF